MKFSEIESLSTKIAIYVPSTIDIDSPVDNSAQVEKTAVFLSDLFGGCTACNVSGYWITQEKKACEGKACCRLCVYDGGKSTGGRRKNN